jgi:uncharacterized RDD family membrane protein YckC
MNDMQAAFCAQCGASQQQGTPGAFAAGTPGAPGAAYQPTQSAVAAAPAYAASYPAAPAAPVSYAGFWIRFLAYIIDSALLGVVAMPIWFLAVGLGAVGAKSSPDAAAMAVLGMMPLFILVSVVGGWLYFALMESSAKQGTVGKMALKLRVTDVNGHKLTFGRATGRYFAKMVNSFTFLIGWIMAGFTAKKQGLHDMIAGTVVLKTSF